jgi:hypothetical protein
MTLNVDHEKNSFHVYDTVPPIQGSLLSLVVASCFGCCNISIAFFPSTVSYSFAILLGVYGLECVGAAKRIQLLSCQTYWLKKHLAHEWC